MPTAISFSSLIPAGLSVERFEVVDGILVVSALSRTREPPVRRAEVARGRCIVATSATFRTYRRPGDLCGSCS